MADRLMVGCCGAYCGTCRAWIQNACAGCKTGYESGRRDIRKARCAMKRCCIPRGLDSCADCDEFEDCETVQGFYTKNGYKYRKYAQAAAYIRANGYEAFLRIADGWTNAYGRYE